MKTKTKKTPTYRYGIEITKPHSTLMYKHNDAIALEMKRNILSEIHLAYSQSIGDIAANGGMDAGEKRLRKIVQAFTGYSFGDGYDLDDIKDEGINTLANVANWMLHEEYGYLCQKCLVPWIKMKMLGFDNPGKNQSLYWVEEDPSNEFTSPALEKNLI